MITITCTNCQNQLTMDDAFAGGVCRCQHCGTIQTVPRANRGGSGAPGAAATQGSGSAKTLWRQTGSGESTGGTGLDDLADIVASSGLAGSGLQSKRLRKSTPPANPVDHRKKLLRILGLFGGGVLAVLLIIAYILSRPDAPPEQTTPQPGNVTGTIAPPVPTISGPSFCGVKLDANSTVAYVLDCGTGTSSVFGQLKSATLKSVRSLTASRKFQIVFWQQHGEVVTVPDTGATVAGDISINEASRKLEDVNAFGSTNVGPAIKKAAASKPDVIVLATGKGDDLEDSFIKDVLDNAPAGTKIYTFSLAGTRSSAQLQSIANKTGADYRTITDAQLSQFAK